MGAREQQAATDAGSLQGVLDALSSPIRREILWMVWNAELAAGEIATAFDVTAPTISSHLTALRSAGLVSMRVDGNFRRYRADRDAMESVLPLLASASDKWQVADDLPERQLAEASTAQWVTVSTEVRGIDRERAFHLFVDSNQYSQWLGVPVTIRDGRFSAELEWGTKVRGHYEVEARPTLIALRWDFDDDAVPVPGRQLIGYLRFFETHSGCRIEVHQRAGDVDQAAFLSAAWSMVLGRLREHEEGTTGSRPRRRPARPKRSPGDRVQ